MNLKLFPLAAKNDDAFWSSIQKYNKLFIKLRYMAVLMLLLLLGTINFVFGFGLSFIQNSAVILVSISIFAYNYFLSMSLFKAANLHQDEKQMQIELIQILLDLIFLSILIYFLGGIEAPIFMFYIFHMILGTLILPTRIMYYIAGGLTLFFFSFSLMEFNGIITHQVIEGLYSAPFYTDLHFVIGFLFVFVVMIFVCIYLTDQVARELYAREIQLKQALEKVKAVEDSKHHYIMAVVHELKSPIVATTSLLDLVLGGYVGEVSDSVKDKVLKAKIRTEDSISTINNIMKISNFKLLNELEQEEIILTNLLLKIEESVKPVCERKNINLTKIGFEDCKIFGDRILLGLAFSNLIGNAVKYTPNDGKVEIEIKHLIENVIIQISDDGIGIPENEQKKVFEEFYRASNTRQHKIEGTGTGLNIVKNVIEAHHGRIELKSPSNLSKKGRIGTTFIVELPLHQ